MYDDTLSRFDTVAERVTDGRTDGHNSYINIDKMIASSDTE